MVETEVRRRKGEAETQQEKLPLRAAEGASTPEQTSSDSGGPAECYTCGVT